MFSENPFFLYAADHNFHPRKQTRTQFAFPVSPAKDLQRSGDQNRAPTCLFADIYLSLTASLKLYAIHRRGRTRREDK